MNDSGVVDRLITWADFKEKKDLKKSDGSKTRRLLDIPKLEDANEAGGSKSHKCTLIITEGDSAKALAVSHDLIQDFHLHSLDHSTSNCGAFVKTCI